MQLFPQVVTGFKCELRILPNIEDEAFCKNNRKLKAVHYFCKNLHLGCLKILLNLAQSNFSQYYEIFQNIYHVDLHFLNGTESSFFTRYTCLIWIAPSNVLWHQNKHLMENFKFLPCSRIICLPLNISGKFNWQHLFEKLEEAETNRLHLF